MSNSTGLMLLVEKLDFQPFVKPNKSACPTAEDLETIAQASGRAIARAVLDGYFTESAEYLNKCGIRAGCVLQIKDGGYMVVGHISERLAFLDEEPFVDLDDIEAIAYIY